MSNIRIDLYSEKYMQDVGLMINHIQKNEFGIPISLDDQPDLVMISDYYRQGNGNFWIATDGDTLVGSIALKDMGNGQASLKKMFVKAEYRGEPHRTGQKVDGYADAMGK